MGIDTNLFPEISEAATNIGVPDFLAKTVEESLSLKELDEVNVQMHVTSQAAFRKTTQGSPASGKSFVGQENGSSEETNTLDDDSLKVAVMQQTCPRCRLSYKWLKGLPVDGKQYYKDV